MVEYPALRSPAFHEDRVCQYFESAYLYLIISVFIEEKSRISLIQQLVEQLIRVFPIPESTRLHPVVDGAVLLLRFLNRRRRFLAVFDGFQIQSAQNGVGDGPGNLLVLLVIQRVVLVCVEKTGFNEESRHPGPPQHHQSRAGFDSQVFESQSSRAPLIFSAMVSFRPDLS